ncbi:MAG TPA: hypothetical protein VFJ72_05650, partial [Rubrobacteraceae bacterium]|nr:hypothetical protein [Rubrobacteraceae bacterium]
MSARTQTRSLVLAFIALGIAGALLAVIAVAPPTLARSARPNEGLRVLSPGERPSGSRTPGSLSALQKRALIKGYLVPDQQGYELAKAAADRKAAAGTGQEAPFAPASAAPTSFRSWQGARDAGGAPSDSTGAIGPGRYVELVNSRYAIYNRTSNVPINQGSLNDLVGAAALESVFDPQIIWDPTTNRFYYAADDVLDSANNFLAFGFSKDSTPDAGPSDWCQYFVAYGADFPDYPKLGDTRDFVMIGSNVFPAAGGFHSSLDWIRKPPAGAGCPNLSSGVKTDLRNSDGTQAITPVPANQTDTSPTGYVVAEPASVPNGAGPAGFLSLFTVSSNTDGTLALSAPRNVTVPGYDLPANAPQRGTTRRLDTSDSRNTQAVSAIDPSRGTGGLTALWTQHTVFGGAGAQVRWYEINPASATLFQRGTVSGSSANGVFDFNGAISPDRKVLGTTRKFGSSMILGYNSSSATQFPSVQMISKVGSNAASAGTLVKASAASLQNFDCSDPNFPGVCRWGDYSAATPDPGSSTTTTHGQVWLT